MDNLADNAVRNFMHGHLTSFLITEVGYKNMWNILAKVHFYFYSVKSKTVV